MQDRAFLWQALYLLTISQFPLGSVLQMVSNGFFWHSCFISLLSVKNPGQCCAVSGGFGWRTDNKIILRQCRGYPICFPEPSFSIWSSLWSLSLSFFCAFQLNCNGISGLTETSGPFRKLKSRYPSPYLFPSRSHTQVTTGDQSKAPGSFFSHFCSSRRFWSVQSLTTISLKDSQAERS